MYRSADKRKNITPHSLNALPTYGKLFTALMFAASMILIFTAARDASAQTEPDPANPAAETPAIEPAPTPAPPAISRDERENLLLAKVKREEVQWLETPDERVLTLFRPTENRFTKGLVLLLHATETPADWPPSLENLRRNLPQYGWATLAAHLPPATKIAIPDRPAAPASETPQDPSAAADPPVAEPNPPASPIINARPRADVIAQRIEAIKKFLAEQGQNNIILITDNTSLPMVLTNLTLTEIQALVLMNLQRQEPLNLEQLNAVFGSPTLPVMDVFLIPIDGQQRSRRKQHRAVALRNKLTYYQQYILPPLQIADIDNERSFWLERVRGFMEENASGTEIPKPANNP